MRPSAIRSLMRDHRASLAAALTLGTGVALMARRALRSTAAAPLSWPPSPPPHPIEGAIFDLDGTLVGSEYVGIYHVPMRALSWRRLLYSRKKPKGNPPKGLTRPSPPRGL